MKTLARHSQPTPTSSANGLTLQNNLDVVDYVDLGVGTPRIHGEGLMSRKIKHGGTFYPGRLHKIICCDCGLVHLLKFDTKNRPPNKPLRVTAWRMDAETAKLRKTKTRRATIRAILRTGTKP